MKTPNAVSCLFVDIGGVLLTTGWDQQMRIRAARDFDLDFPEMEERHGLTVGNYEEGEITLGEYLDRVVFHTERPFSMAQFRNFLFEQSHAYPEMIQLVASLKARHGLKIVVVNNEGRELNAHRISRFRLDELADVFVSSCFVHVRKPHASIFRLALDIAQVSPSEVVYLDNTKMFVQIAQSLDIRSIHHTDFESTRAAFAALGL